MADPGFNHEAGDSKETPCTACAFAVVLDRVEAARVRAVQSGADHIAALCREALTATILLRRQVQAELTAKLTEIARSTIARTVLEQAHRHIDAHAIMTTTAIGACVTDVLDAGRHLSAQDAEPIGRALAALLSLIGVHSNYAVSVWSTAIALLDAAAAEAANPEEAVCQ